jgi:hypothetical protein
MLSRQAFVEALRANVLPAIAALGALVVVTLAVLIAMLALRSEEVGSIDLSGEWRIGMVTTGRSTESAPDLLCLASLQQEGSDIMGAFACEGGQASSSVTGVVAHDRRTVFLSAQFAEGAVEIRANYVSSVQLSGTWQDANGTQGRFLATRSSSTST